MMKEKMPAFAFRDCWSFAPAPEAGLLVLFVFNVGEVRMSANGLAFVIEHVWDGAASQSNEGKQGY